MPHEVNGLDSHLIGLENDGLAGDLSTFVTGVGREHRNQPWSIRAREIIPIQLLGHGVPTLGRSVGNSTPLHDVRNTSGQRHDDDGDQQSSHTERLTT